MSLKINESRGGVTFWVKVVPGSSRKRVAGLLGHALKINLSAVAEQGKANKELTRYLTQLLDRPESSITVVSGVHNPRKKIHVKDINPAQLRKTLAEYII